VRDGWGKLASSAARTRKKGLQSKAKRSSSRNQPEAQVEVQMNSRFFRGFGFDAEQAACIIAAHAARA
jgi:hypothetical protein